jgi:putative pyruvate formate lyase activating enzyme
MMNESPHEAAYLSLARTGELERRATALSELARECRLCPRGCLARRREAERGNCGAGRRASLVSAGPHHGEEECLSGWRGSGTIFFGHCNLHCVFCQNADISQDHAAAQSVEVETEVVAQAMLKLQSLGCHNINWVSPTHCLDSIALALLIAAQGGLHLPIVYNTNGYDSLEALGLLDGVVDIYMPDLKYADNCVAERLGAPPDYVDAARAAIVEMHRQAGDLQLDARGIAFRGVLIRHLVLPENLAGTTETLSWIRDALGSGITVNLMAQYRPAHDASRFPEIARALRAHEYGEAVAFARQLGFRNLLTQSSP